MDWSDFALGFFAAGAIAVVGIFVFLHKMFKSWP